MNMFRRLTYQPVLHACGHFEVRFMRPYPESPVEAGSPCRTCDPQGRPPGPNFTTLEAAQAACDKGNQTTGREVAQ